MGKLVNKINSDDVHPGVDHAFNAITINSALHAAYEDKDEDHHHKSKKEDKESDHHHKSKKHHKHIV